MNRCTYINLNGSQCRNPALDDSDFCQSHFISSYIQESAEILSEKGVESLFVSLISDAAGFFANRSAKTKNNKTPFRTPRQKPNPILLARKFLEIDPAISLTPDLIKAQKRKLAAKYHPDKEGGSEEKMRQINLAAELLQNHLNKRS